MIQRIQTVFILLVAILGVVFSFVPILFFSHGDTEFLMGAYKTINITTEAVLTKNMGVGVLQGIVILLAVVIVMLYKNRALQMKLGKLTILLLALQIAAIVMYSDSAKTAINAIEGEVSTGFQFGAIIPVLSLVLTYLAIRFIKKDDELVRSADRLR